MAAHYDQYDYPHYWEGREYEHLSETVAIGELLKKVPKVRTIIDIGAGYGRLTPEYLFRAKKAILTDPSAKLLSLARKSLQKFHHKQLIFLQSCIENLEKKIRTGSADLAIMVRVLHHLEDADRAFRTIHKLLTPRGFLILEFANKSHFKACVCEFCKGNFTFPMNIFPKDIRCTKNIKKKTIPFINYHPDIVKKKLVDAGFEVLESRSISNIRLPFAKKLLSLDLLKDLETFLQKPLSYLNFGPSIMVLARKTR